MELEATLCSPTFLIVLEIINLARQHCIATLVASLFIEDGKLTDFPNAVNKA